MMIKAVIFDIDNTLYGYDKANEKAMAKLKEYCAQNLQTDENTFNEVFSASMEIVKERIGYECAAIHNRLLRFECMLELLKKPVFRKALEMHNVYWDALISYAQPEEGVKELFELLSRKGVKIGVGSDMTIFMQYRKLQKLGLLDYLHFIVASEEAGVEKPSSKLFKLCAQKAGCLAQECAFIGDSLKKDYEGSEKAGMKGVWYNPNHISGDAKRIAYSFKECVSGDIVKFGDDVVI